MAWSKNQNLRLEARAGNFTDGERKADTFSLLAPAEPQTRASGSPTKLGPSPQQNGSATREDLALELCSCVAMKMSHGGDLCI
jgi:hypothetical protein